jgi:ribonuclease HII
VRRARGSAPPSLPGLELIVPDAPPRAAPAEPLACGEIEDWARARGSGALIGLDEAGRGPLAGPVVVAACALPDPVPLEGLDDSKRLTELAREALFEPILAHALGVGLVVVEPDVIDALNILHASLHGMAVAWEQLVSSRPELRSAKVLVDGKDKAPLPGDVLQWPLIKGDARSLNIAAASILAKVARDRIMRRHHLDFPIYGFDRHKGYPTPEHRAAVQRHGPSPIHRRSFTLPGPEDEA